MFFHIGSIYYFMAYLIRVYYDYAYALVITCNSFSDNFSKIFTVVNLLEYLMLYIILVKYVLLPEGKYDAGRNDVKNVHTFKRKS